MFIGFGIKVPMFPFHTWLPDAHTQAPTQGSVILAAVLLKLGTYGFVRIAIPILPEAAAEWAPWIGLLAVIGIIYGALGCLAQTDMKRLIAFSSVAHMGFVMLGIATLTDFGINAAVFGMVAHGLITGMLFFIAGSVKERYHTLEIKRLGGLLVQAPQLGWILGFCAMASLGLPGLAGFWGEFPAILSAYNPAAGLPDETFRTYMVVAAVGTVLAAGYLLWLLQRTAFGEPSDEFADDPEITDVVDRLEWICAGHRCPRPHRASFGVAPGLIFDGDRSGGWSPTSLQEAVVETGTCEAAARRGRGGRRLQSCSPSLAQADGDFVRPPIDWHAVAPELDPARVRRAADADRHRLAREGSQGSLPSLAGIGLLATLIPILTLAARRRRTGRCSAGPSSSTTTR